MVVDRLSHKVVDAYAPGRAHHWQSDSCAGSSAESPELELFTGELPIKGIIEAICGIITSTRNCDALMFIEFNLYYSHMTCMPLSHFTAKKSNV